MSTPPARACADELLAQQSRDLRHGAELAGRRLQAAIQGLQGAVDGFRTSLLGASPGPAVVQWGPEAAVKLTLIPRNGHD